MLFLLSSAIVSLTRNICKLKYSNWQYIAKVSQQQLLSQSRGTYNGKVRGRIRKLYAFTFCTYALLQSLQLCISLSTEGVMLAATQPTAE
jgi:hypothetical protein